MATTTTSYTERQGLPAWVATQHKAFLRWANTYFENKGIEPLTDLKTDLGDGIKLVQLLEIIGNESLGKYYKSPRLRIQKIENVNTALGFIKHRGIQLHNIGAEDITDGNLKLILGLLWILVLRFTISEINEEGLSAKEGLLLWCQRKTAGYEGVDIRDFSTSWCDGRAFCALIDRHRPDLLDYDELDFSNPKEATALAFQVAHEQVGIPQLLDVEDVCDVTKPDERSVMTYVAYWFHAFSELDKIETAGRRLEKFVEVTGSALHMQHSFERRMRELLEKMCSMQAQWNEAKFTGSYMDAKRQSQEFFQYKNSTKREWVTEKAELASLLGNIRTKLATYGLKEYIPPQGLGLHDLEVAWGNLVKAEASRSQLINHKLREIKEELRKSFAATANEFALSLNTVSLRISDLHGELESQLEEITLLGDKLKPLSDLLRDLRKLRDKCIEANVEENDYTVYSYDELEYELGLAKQSVVKKLAFIENQIVARSMTNLTPIQLEEFESVFRYFDKTHRNQLSESEFSGALASLGLVYSEEEMHEVFELASEDGNSVSFEQFINFMVEVTEDQQTSEQVLQSFADIANGKPYVTELDLQNSLIPDAMIDQLKDTMPTNEDGEGLDYVTYMSKLQGD